MPHTRWAVLLLTVILSLALARPASAAAFTQQCDESRGCLNFWAGNYAVESYYGTAANNWITVQGIGSGQFELRDNIHGGCVADLGGAGGQARAGGGQDCPSSGSAAWGSVFVPDYVCPSGWAAYKNRHWQGYIYVPPGNGQVIYLNTRTPDCLQQQA